MVFSGVAARSYGRSRTRDECLTTASDWSGPVGSGPLAVPTPGGAVMGQLDGAVALVTGGARGIGAAVARTFVAEGAVVVIADVLEEEGRRQAAELGASADFVPLDVTNEADWQHAVECTEERFGPISVLVNNAGVVELGPIEQQSTPCFRRVLN